MFVGIFLFLLYILSAPAQAVRAAADGLSLWYERVLPALLPFAILSNILICSNCAILCARRLVKPLRFLFPASEAGIFVLCTGFLFGFPMGSKNCASLLASKDMSFEEANVLFCITNNISPVFINSYILTQELCCPELFVPSLILLYGPPLLLGRFLLRKKTAAPAAKKTASRSQMNFKIIDASIMNGFEALVKIGGYIMLFSIVITLICSLPLPWLCKLLLVNLTEITNGIHLLAASTLPFSVKYVLAMVFTAFGGLCGIAQTSSMIKGTSLSIRHYLCIRVLLAFCSGVLALLAIRLFLPL